MYHAKPNDVVNMSLGGPSLPFPVFNKSIKKLQRKIFFAIAAGNEGFRHEYKYSASGPVWENKMDICS